MQQLALQPLAYYDACMAFKHQAHCYRNIGGVRFENHADLIYGEEENAKVVAEARAKYRRVRIIKRDVDLKAVFVAEPKVETL